MLFLNLKLGEVIDSVQISTNFFGWLMMCKIQWGNGPFERFGGFLLIFFLTTVILLSKALAQSQGNLSRNSQINDLLNATFAYTSVALGCSDKHYLDLKTRLVQLLEIANSKGDLLRDGKQLARDLSSLIEAGAEEFKRRPYVTCDEADKYYQPLIDSLDYIIKMNR